MPPSDNYALYRGVKALAVARKQGLLVSVHPMESGGAVEDMTPDACEAAGRERSAFVWADEDPQFPSDLQRVLQERPDEIEALMEDRNISLDEFERRYTELGTTLGTPGRPRGHG